MKTNTTIIATKRTETRKKAKLLVAAGKVPATIYEKGHDSISITIDLLSAERAVHAVGKHKPVEIDVEGSKKLAMIKDFDKDPVRHKIRHMEFHAIKQNELVHAEVQIEIEANSEAEKASLLVVEVIRSVEIEALPANLPDKLVVSNAKLIADGDKVTVADIIAVKGVTVKSPLDTVLAVVEIPRDAEAEAAADAVAAASAPLASEVPSANGTPTPTVAETKPR
jgi:large subunit ribosomal protein L25